ncbi:uncharacterized protein LOC131029794 [Cryptomeria japonica]|uniref:uncharacterized protein LOC131029794 n=1 Tax=Cryptomeria japonica TaxID=3369 RepID=UPI0025AB5E54|nr:uncharacterized protein LOC131029794 [Cryptomeria japonica]
MVYGRKVMMPVEFEHKTLRTVISLDMTLSVAQEERLLQLNALDEIRKSALQHIEYLQNHCLKWHDHYIKYKSFHLGDWALLYDSRYKDNLGKLQTWWLGPYEIIETFSIGVVRLSIIDPVKFKLLFNDHQLHLYHKPLSKDDFLRQFSTTKHAKISTATDDNILVTTPS